MGGLGAFLEPCRAGLAAEVQKCTPEVSKFARFGGILGVKLEPKSFNENYDFSFTFLFFFEAHLEAKTAPKSLQNGTQTRLQDAFQRAWKRKSRKCKFEQHYDTLARFLGCEGAGNFIKIDENVSKVA